MAQTRFHITTAIDYANGLPHLGHAFEKIEADCVARYRRLIGDRVHFVTGLDEHGQTVAQYALNAGIPPQAWVDEIANEYRDVLRTLSVSCDDFIRTTEPRHARAVREVLRRIEQRRPDDIYEATCTGWYCRGCEAFKLPNDLFEGRCPEHPTLDPEWVEERSRFFRLSAYTERLRDHYDTHADFVVPGATFDQMRSLVVSGLRDCPISRNQPWGLLFPGAPGYTIHVWFDALVSYLSGTGFPDQRYEQLWPADVQIVGPDITHYHGVLWPAMLMAAGLEPPRRIWTHGWLRMDGARFAKTARVRVPLSEAVTRHGVDALRYFLLLTMPWEGNGDFSWGRFDSVYATDLANLGKLTSRAVSLTICGAEGRVPHAGTDGELDQSHRTVVAEYREAMSALHVREGALTIVRLVDLANRYADRWLPSTRSTAPRTTLRDDKLAELHRAVVRIAVLAQPFMPSTAEELYRTIGGRGSIADLRWHELAHPSTGGWEVVSGQRALLQ